MEIYLVRHTQLDLQKGVCYGQSDVRLKKSFKQESDAVFEKIPTEISTLYSSPLSRCTELAEKIASRLGIKVNIDPRLMELNFGEWELKKWNDLNQEKLNHWMNHYEFEKCPGGESYQDLHNRCLAFLNSLRSFNQKPIVVITHSGFIKTALAIIQQKEIHETIGLSFNYGEVVSVNFTKKE